MVIVTQINLIVALLFTFIWAAELDFDWAKVGSDACFCYWKNSEQKNNQFCRCSLLEPASVRCFFDQRFFI